MNVKTKSGFSCKVNENKVKDWRYVRAAAKAIIAKSDMEALEPVMFMVNFILGEEQEEKLIAPVADKDGVASAIDVQKEFEEITNLIGEELKKSEGELLKKS